jgi:hypothetical protein
MSLIVEYKSSMTTTVQFVLLLTPAMLGKKKTYSKSRRNMQQRQPASGLLKECAHKLREEKEIAAN